MATTHQSTTKKSTASASKKRAATRARKKAVINSRRILTGLGLFFLALCIFASYFHVDAIVISWIADGLKGLFGWGYWMSGFAVLWMGFILVDHKYEKLTNYLVCCALFTLLFGSIFHLFSCKDSAYEIGLEGLKNLWNAGIELQCGGVISGGLAELFVKLFHRAVSAIMLIAGAIVTLFVALRLTPEKVKAAVEETRSANKEKDQLLMEEHQEYLEHTAQEPRRSTENARSKAGKHSVIDIPLDDEKPAEKESVSREGSLLKQRPNNILTPAQALNADTLPSVGSDDEREERTDTELSDATMPHRGTKDDIAEIQKAAEEVKNEVDQEMTQTGHEYKYPPLTLLKPGKATASSQAGTELRENSKRLANTLNSFGVDAVAGEVVRGPSVTRYEFILAQGVKLSKLTNLSDDIALALGASGVRIAPVPGKIGAVGIEVPNTVVSPVQIREVLESKEFTQSGSNTAFALGKNIAGHSIVGNIGKLPHVLIAGTTGSGKSVCTNSLIVSMLYKSSPEEVRFIMVDPKMVELAPYAGIPHLLIPVVTDPKKAAGALQWSVYEMMKRYKVFSEQGVKDLAGFNELAEKNESLQKLPSVVIVIDELADLMLVAAKEVEESICRVAQMGRAAGVHLVIATQRPSADVITGLMKANIPSRIAFAVASSLESRIILDTAGAEKLVGKGDMLYFPLGDSKPTRVQGCFISPEEIEKVVAFVKESGEAQYDQTVIAQIQEVVDRKENSGKQDMKKDVTESNDDADELLPAAVDVIIETGQASVSMLQRKLKLGYSRAARLVDQMEERGIVGPFEGSKPRQILITKARWQEMQMNNDAQQQSSAPDKYGTIHDALESHDALD